jgi:hypothetical protein
MAKLTSIAASAWQHVLLFGPPKCGKTLLAGELAQHGYTMDWFDLEQGFNTLRQLPAEAQENINIIQLPDSPAFPIAVETCLKVIKQPVGAGHSICRVHGKVSCPICAKAPDAEYDVVNMYQQNPNHVFVFDSITQLVNSAINHIKKNKPEDYKFEWDDWGNLGVVMDRFLSYIQTMPAHVICISHEMEVKMEDGKMKLVATAGTQNFSRNSAKYFDHVVYGEVKNKKHIAASSTTYAQNILTGSRLGVATETAASPTLVDIFKGKIPSAQAQKPVIQNLKAAVTPHSWSKINEHK